MKRFTLRAVNEFYDIKTGDLYKIGELFEIEEETRVRDMVNRGLASLVAIKADPGIKKHGNKIMVYQTLLYWIGGIETADYNIAQTFKDRDITFVFKEADLEQALRIGKYCDVYIDQQGVRYCADVLILQNYESYEHVKGRVKARKIYQYIHADWKNMKAMEIWQHFDWQPDDDVDKILSCSETAAKGLLEAFDKPIESQVVPNIVCADKNSEFKVFLTLSRFTAEKGGEAVIKMVSEFNKANKPFLWIITATELDFGIYSTLKKDRSVLFVTPGINNPKLIEHVDYLVQLSKNESFGYSMHEALAKGVPVIATRLPETEKIITQGKNGYLVGQNLEGLDVEAIFNKKPKFEPVEEKVDPVWAKVLDGKL